MSGETFQGKPCVKCNSTERYISRGNCKACASAYITTWWKNLIPEKRDAQLAKTKEWREINKPVEDLEISKKRQAKYRGEMADAEKFEDPSRPCPLCGVSTFYRKSSQRTCYSKHWYDGKTQLLKDFNFKL